MDIEPQLLSKQQEWSDLLKLNSIKQSPEMLNKETLFGRVTKRYLLASVWLDDAIHARQIDFPRSDRELQFHIASRSNWLRHIFNITAYLQLIAPFLERPRCSFSKSSEVENNVSGQWIVDGSISRYGLTVLDILFLLVYVYDLALSFAVNPQRKSFLRKPWSTFRLFCCTLLFFDCIVYFGVNDINTPRLVRCIYPFFLISRRNNLKLMLQGLISSAYQARFVIKALASVLILWGFTGFFLFRDIDGSNVATFDTPWQGIFTSLHCFTSRPYVLRALNPLFSVSSASAVFFVSLTLAADILCINFIIAVAGLQYRKFAIKTLEQRLMNRKIALSAIFIAFSSGEDDDRKFSLSSWIHFCENLEKDLALDKNNATIIFSTQDKDGTGTIDEEGFFSLCALIAARVKISEFSPEGDDDDDDDADHESTHQHVDSLQIDRGRDKERDRERDTIQRITTITVPNGSYESSSNSSSSSGSSSRNSSSNSNNNSSSSGGSNSRGVSNSSSNSSNGNTRETSTISPLAIAYDTSNESRNTHSLDLPSWDGKVRKPLKPYLTKEEEEAAIAAAPSQHSNHDNSINTSSSSSITSSKNKWFICVWTKVEACLDMMRFVSRQIASAHIFIGIDYLACKTKLHLFSSCTLIMHVLLVAQLSNISSGYGSDQWYSFGSFLEFYFWLAMFINMLNEGTSHFLSSLKGKIDMILNISSAIALLVLGNHHYHHGLDDTLVAVLVIQSLRLFHIFFFFNDIQVFEFILPILIRAMFIYFSVLYFFAIFAHSFFCGSLINDSATSTGDDDASSWSNYSNLLNFSSNLQSIYTLFEMSILGNWSMVMDASAKTDGVASYIFFYFFRLTTTLAVLPILISFIMQAFLSATVQTAARNNSNRINNENQQHQHDKDNDNDNDNKMNMKMKMKNVVTKDAGRKGTGGDHNNGDSVVEINSISHHDSANNNDNNNNNIYINKYKCKYKIRSQNAKATSMISIWSPDGVERVFAPQISSTRLVNTHANANINANTNTNTSVVEEFHGDEETLHETIDDLRKRLEDALVLLHKERESSAHMRRSSASSIAAITITTTTINANTNTVNSNVTTKTATSSSSSSSSSSSPK